jgi:hypothetical protein
MSPPGQPILRKPAALFAGSPGDGPPTLIPVLEIDAEHVATVAAAKDGWAALLADGRSYKAEGDVSDLLWWAIKTVRFEAGELDPYDPSIHRLDLDDAIL